MPAPLQAAGTSPPRVLMFIPALPLLLIGALCASGRQDGRDAHLLSAAPANDGRLRFRADGTFTVLQLTDLHYGENATLDAKSDEFQRAMLSAEQPDLVVFSGDMVSGWVCRRGKADPPGGAACGPGWFAARFEQLTAPVKAAGIPWALILGNHDGEAELTRREIVGLAVRTGGAFGLTRQGPPQASGASNYWLDVHPPLPPTGGNASSAGGEAQGEDGSGSNASSEAQGAASGSSGRAGVDAGEDGGAGAGAVGTAGGASVEGADVDGPAARVWLLDSMDRYCPPLMFGWGCVAPDTVAWLNGTTRQLPQVPSLAFVHIPVPQFMQAWAAVPTMGRKEEDVCCPLRDTGLFDVAKTLGINAFYSGHDHNNDYAGVLDGVRLAYGRKSGFGGYGPPQGWLRGARVIQLRLGQDTAESETWIRQEDGSQSYQKPSEQPKDMTQLICCADEFGRQPELRERVLELLQQGGEHPEAGQASGERQLAKAFELALAAELEPAVES